MYKVLLIDDEIRIQEIVTDFFLAKGLKVICANNGIEGIEKLKEIPFDLVLLDIMMPKLDGFNTCKWIRKEYEVPIIFITAKVDESNQLEGYEFGADDYVTKPFSLSVLYAKCISLIKRDKKIVIDEMLKVGNIRMNVKEARVWNAEGEVYLAPIEFNLLRLLMINRNQILTREKILTKIWGYDFDGNERVLDNHIKKLRKALGKEGKRIRTVIKIGYRLEE